MRARWSPLDPRLARLPVSCARLGLGRLVVAACSEGGVRGARSGYRRHPRASCRSRLELVEELSHPVSAGLSGKVDQPVHPVAQLERNSIRTGEIGQRLSGCGLGFWPLDEPISPRGGRRETRLWGGGLRQRLPLAHSARLLGRRARGWHAHVSQPGEAATTPGNDIVTLAGPVVSPVCSWSGGPPNGDKLHDPGYLWRHRGGHRVDRARVTGRWERPPVKVGPDRLGDRIDVVTRKGSANARPGRNPSNVVVPADLPVRAASADPIRCEEDNPSRRGTPPLPSFRRVVLREDRRLKHGREHSPLRPVRSRSHDPIIGAEVRRRHRHRAQQISPRAD